MVGYKKLYDKENREEYMMISLAKGYTNSLGGYSDFDIVTYESKPYFQKREGGELTPAEKGDWAIFKRTLLVSNGDKWIEAPPHVLDDMNGTLSSIIHGVFDAEKIGTYEFSTSENILGDFRERKGITELPKGRILAGDERIVVADDGFIYLVIHNYNSSNFYRYPIANFNLSWEEEIKKIACE